MFIGMLLHCIFNGFKWIRIDTSYQRGRFSLTPWLTNRVTILDLWLAHRENLFKESKFQLFSYSIDHFHVPKFDSNGFCWMNIEDVYWRKDDVMSDKIATSDTISREIVCNFDGQGFYSANRQDIFYRLIHGTFDSVWFSRLNNPRLNPPKDVTIPK